MNISQKWRTATIVFLAAGVLTFAVTAIFISPKYESTAVIFPPNTHANMLLVQQGVRFGYDKEIGEQIEVLNANAVRQKLVDEFDLLQRYEIDTTEKYWREKLRYEFDQNFMLSRTINKSIKIEVRANQPGLAAKMANRWVVLADAHKGEMVRQNIAPAANAAKATFEEKQQLVDQMADSLETMRQAGESVWTYGEERKSGRYQNYELQYRKELDRLHHLKSRWEDLRDLMNENVPKSYVASRAVPATKPVYPKKLLTSAIAAVLAALIYLAGQQLFIAKK